MKKYHSIKELEEAQACERNQTLQEIEKNEGYLRTYRQDMSNIQENFYVMAAHFGVLDAPEFTMTYNRIVDEVEHNSKMARREIENLEEDYQNLKVKQNRVLEDYRDGRDDIN